MYRIFFAIICILFHSFFVFSNAESTSSANDQKVLNIIELYKDPAKYDGKIIPVEGLYYEEYLKKGSWTLGGEPNSYLYVSGEPPGPTRAVGIHLKIKLSELEKKYRHLLNKKVIVRGKFVLFRPRTDGGIDHEEPSWRPKGDLVDIVEFKEKNHSR